MRRLAGLIGMVLVCGLSACVAPEGDLSAIPPMPSTFAANPASALGQAGHDARAPSGYLAFCDRNPDDCRGRSGQPDRIKFTSDLLDTLEKVNLVVNATIRPE